MTDRQCPSCGGVCKKHCERADAIEVFKPLFKEFAIGKFVLRFYKTDHVWTCTMTENMLDKVKMESEK